MNMQFINTPSTASAHGPVWGDFRISCMIQENGQNRPFKGSVEWTAHPRTPGVNERDVLLHLAESMIDEDIGDTSPGGCLSIECSVVDGLANDDEGAKASVMKEIQKAWSGLVSYSLPPTNGDSP